MRRPPDDRARRPQRHLRRTRRAALAPPHSLEAEQSVLGAILLSERALYALVIEEGLKAEDFYRERHQLIYEAMLALYGESEPIDVLTVTEQLRSRRASSSDAGGQAAVDALAASVPAAGNARHYARIVREHALMRRLLTTTYEIQASVAAAATARRATSSSGPSGAMLEVAHDDRQKDFRSIEEVLDAELDKLHRLSLEQHRADRHAVGLQGPRRDHRRLPARQPRHHRRAPVDGQVGAGQQHRRERGDRAQRAGRPVQPRDVRDRARPALRRLPGADQGRRAAQGPRRRAQVAEDPRGQLSAWPARRCSSTTRRTSACSRSARSPAACTSSTGSG